MPISKFRCVYGENYGAESKIWKPNFDTNSTVKKGEYAIENNKMKQMMNLEYATSYSYFRLYEIDDVEWKQLFLTIEPDDFNT